MPQVDFFSSLAVGITEDRIAPYRASDEHSESGAYGTYAWNIALCESLYPALNCLEISLRNSIHSAALQEFGVEDWFKGRLHRNELETLTLRYNELSSRSRQQSIGINELIGDLSLGFWVSLFRSRYEQVLWPKLLEPVFPHWDKGGRTRRNAYARLDRIRRLRNLVFHHGAIWHWTDLADQHRLILETIGWISPAMLAATRLLDRFDSVYTRGSQPYAAELETIAQNWNE